LEELVACRPEDHDPQGEKMPSETKPSHKPAAKSPNQQETEDEIFHEMPSLPDPRMDQDHLLNRDFRVEETQDRRYQETRVPVGKSAGRQPEDQCQAQDRGKPIPDEMLFEGHAGASWFPIPWE
jgi:hypothetical protein